jgi:hypothetical protein
MNSYRQTVHNPIWVKANPYSQVIAFVCKPNQNALIMTLVPNRYPGSPVTYRSLAQFTRTLQVIGFFNAEGQLEHIYFSVVHVD